MVDKTTLPVVCSLALLGLALGFVAAGLATEPVEGMTAGGSETVAAKAVLTAVATVALVWGALRLRDRAWGPFLAGLAVGTPAFFAFYEVDHTEAAVGSAVAMALAWATLQMETPGHLRTAARVVTLPAALGLFLTTDPSGPIETVALVSALLFTAASFLRSNLSTTLGRVALGAWLLMLGAAAGPYALDQSPVGRLWPFFLGMVGVGTLLAWSLRGFLPRRTPEPTI